MADLRTSYQRVIVELEQLLPLEFDVLCKEGISESLESLLEEVYSKLYDASNSGSLDQFCEVVLATMDSSLKVLHDYIEKAVMTLADGTALIKSYHRVLCIIGVMSSCKSVCSELVGRGLLVHMEHLERFCGNPLTQTLRRMVLSLLTTIYNCAYNAGITSYPLQIPYFTFILEPYCKCSDLTISLSAKMILAMVRNVLLDEDFEIFKLKMEELDAVVAALKEVSTSSDESVSLFDSEFSPEEMLFSLKHLLWCKANREMLVQADVVPSFAALLHCSNDAIKILTCCILLNLLMETSFTASLLSSDLPLLDTFHELALSPNSEVKSLAFCLLEKLGSSDTGVDKGQLAKTLYSCEFFDRAVDMIESDSKSSGSAVKLISGMSKFKLYRREQFLLRQSKSLLPAPEWHRRHQLCYEDAKICIQSLCSVLDDTGKLDDEPSFMLDQAIIDYSTQTNSLFKLRRCALCRKKGKLYHSHVFPHSILEAICSSVSFPTNKKSVDSYRQGHLRTPKQTTTFLFCSSCEKVFSDHGETQFPPLFFRKVYDEAKPSSILLEQDIEYGEWLYLFCVGIVFRSLCESLDDGYINDSSFYDLFTQCRRCLLDPTRAKSVTDDQRPLLAMIINPTRGDEEDVKYGFINFALTSGLGLTTLSILTLDALVPLSPLKVHFVFVSFGVFSLIALVERENAEYLSKECFINPHGGIYHVLEDAKRREIIPTGLWKLFRETAEEHEKRYVEGMMLNVSKHQIEDPDPDRASTFGIADAFQSDVAAFGNVIVPAPLQDNNKVINHIPAGFSVTNLPGQQLLCLPQGHRCIMHFNIILADDEGATIFLAVENNLSCPDSIPYIIYHEYLEGVQINSAFYIDRDTAVAGQYFLDKSKEIVNRSQGVEELHSNIDSVLPMLLDSKGIQSLKSLLFFSQKRPHTNFDIKCADHLRCWYCNNRCNICMEPAAFGMITVKEDGNRLFFCSQKCQSLLSLSASEDNLQALDSFESPPHTHSHTSALSSEHRELAYIFFQSSSEEGYGYFDLTLVLGDTESGGEISESIYCVMYYRGLQEQHLVGFYMSEKLEPKLKADPLLSSYFPEKNLDQFSPSDISNLIATSLVYLECADLKALVVKHMQKQ